MTSHDITWHNMTSQNTTRCSQLWTPSTLKINCSIAIQFGHSNSIIICASVYLLQATSVLIAMNRNSYTCRKPYTLTNIPFYLSFSLPSHLPTNRNILYSHGVGFESKQNTAILGHWAMGVVGGGGRGKERKIFVLQEVHTLQSHPNLTLSILEYRTSCRLSWHFVKYYTTNCIAHWCSSCSRCHWSYETQ